MRDIAFSCTHFTSPLTPLKFCSQEHSKLRNLSPWSLIIYLTSCHTPLHFQLFSIFHFFLHPISAPNSRHFDYSTPTQGTFIFVSFELRNFFFNLREPTSANFFELFEAKFLYPNMISYQLVFYYPLRSSFYVSQNFLKVTIPRNGDIKNIFKRF